jgi:hypothetical protein
LAACNQVLKLHPPGHYYLYHFVLTLWYRVCDRNAFILSKS